MESMGDGTTIHDSGIRMLPRSPLPRRLVKTTQDSSRSISAMSGTSHLSGLRDKLLETAARASDHGAA
jgi:hypothetical protein